MIPKTISGKLHKLKSNMSLDKLVRGKVEIAKDEIIVAGKYFGNEINEDITADIIKKINLRCLVVSSINRRVFRLLINIGIPVVICPEAFSQFRGGEKVEINLPEGKIISKKTTVKFYPFSDEVMGIIDSGGLIPYTKKNINR